MLSTIQLYYIFIHNPPSFGAQRPRRHSFFPSIDVGPPQIHPLWSLVSLLTHYLVSTPLQGRARRLTHRPMSDSDTIYNGPDPPYLQSFKTRLLGEGFHILINGGLFSFPTNVGHHKHRLNRYFHTTSYYIISHKYLILI